MNTKNACACKFNKGLTRQYYSKGQLDFYECKECGVVFRDPMPSEDELSEIYSELYGDASIKNQTTNQESSDYAVNQYFLYLKKIITDKNRVILDYGCGTGLLVKKLRNSGFGAFGVETSGHARSFAMRDKEIILFENLDSFERNSLGVVTLIEVIEHLINPLGTIQNIYDKIQPGGQIFITTPNLLGARSLMERGNWREAQKRFHVVFFNRKSLTKLLQNAGFSRIEFIRYSPLQRGGLWRTVFLRCLQTLGISGTLCMRAYK